jgi:N-acetyl-alpha-D-glucosaminyl L-malate synthase BshA
LRIGIACYPTYGGSGAVATELGIALATRGHHVHLISYDMPFRLRDARDTLFFHKVDVAHYPLLGFPHYSLILASKLKELIEEEALDLLHVHYAMPHAISAHLAREMARRPVRVVTTLHGTDITLVADDPGYRPLVEFAMAVSDGITAVSRYLLEETIKRFPVDTPTRVIHNFIDPARFDRPPTAGRKLRFASPEERLVAHLSNFRPLKRVGDVIRIFHEIQKAVPARLVMIGDGPELHNARELSCSLGLGMKVHFIGSEPAVWELLPLMDLFLLTSAEESFGMAALEAMASGVPVVAADTGGIPEVVRDGISGFLCDVGDIDAFSSRGLQLLCDGGLHRRIREAGRRDAWERFGIESIVSEYETFYRETMR